MRLRPFAAASTSLLLVAASAAAQNSTAEPPVVTPPPPATKAEPPPPSRPDTPTATVPDVEPVDPVPAPSSPVVVTPAPQTVPLEPMTIDPDAAYPEGFGDPSDPFSNELSVSYGQRDDDGFPWGLLGLLGLLGLIPLFRDRGERIVHVRRDEEIHRPARRDPSDL